jgi:hypothetical protein
MVLSSPEGCRAGGRKSPRKSTICQVPKRSRQRSGHQRGVVQNPCFLRYTDELTRPAFSGKINIEYETI